MRCHAGAEKQGAERNAVTHGTQGDRGVGKVACFARCALSDAPGLGTLLQAEVVPQSAQSAMRITHRLTLRNISLTYSTMPRPSAHADPFLAVADPTRRAILDQLRGGDAPVTELAAAFDMTRPAVSRHLRVLRDARLVRERRGGEDGRQRIYQLTPDPLREVAQWAEGYTVFWRVGLSRLKRHVERGAVTARKER